MTPVVSIWGLGKVVVSTMAANGDGGAPEATGSAEPAGSAGAGSAREPRPVIISTTFRETGTTGVHTHFQQVAQFLREHGTPVKIVTPFSWARPLTSRCSLPGSCSRRVSGTASVLWYRHWHEVFLRGALARGSPRLATASSTRRTAQTPGLRWPHGGTRGSRS